MSDAESLELLREIAADEAGLPSQLAGRVSGSTIGELRKDARQLARDLGYTQPQPRTPTGQFASFNDQLRAAAIAGVPLLVTGLIRYSAAQAR